MAMAVTVVCVLVALLVAFQVFGCDYDEINVNRDHNNEDDIAIEKDDQIFYRYLHQSKWELFSPELCWRYITPSLYLEFL